MHKWTADEIQGFRKSVGLTQAQLAERLGVSPNYVYLMEKGVKVPSKTLRILLTYVVRELIEQTAIEEGDSSGTNSDTRGLQET